MGEDTFEAFDVDTGDCDAVTYAGDSNAGQYNQMLQDSNTLL